jgi:hypothetical protein
MEFYKQVFRLKGWNWNDGRMSRFAAALARPRVPPRRRFMLCFQNCCVTKRQGRVLGREY